MKNVALGLRSVRNRIAATSAKCNRSADSINLLAVSKTQPPAIIEAAYNEGQLDFGESYVQEAISKIKQLNHLPLIWHFIGQLQSNKTKNVAEHFDWVHSVDREHIANRLNDQRPKNFKPLNICIQVKLDPELAKGGITPENLLEFAAYVTTLPQLKLRGLMVIPAAAKTQSEQRQTFGQLRQLQEMLRTKGVDTDTLSMGMSNDFEAAIMEGATIVRIGTAIFGKRNG